MNILITGSSGFIGANLINQLQKTHHRLYLLSHNSTSRILRFDRVTILHLRLHDWKLIDWSNIDLVINLASYGVNAPFASNNLYFQINTLDTLNFLQSSISAGVKKVIHIGSCFEYGDSANEYNYIPASAVLKPTNDYSFAKAATSLALISLLDELQFLKVSLHIYRLFHVYGMGEKPTRFWPQLVQAAISNQYLDMSNGDQVRDFINVNDVVFFLLQEISSIEHNTCIKIQNVGTGKSLTLAEFAVREWNKLSDNEPLLNFGSLDPRPNEIKRLVPCLQPIYY